MHLVSAEDWGYFISSKALPYETFDGYYYEMNEEQYNIFENCLNL